MLITLSDCNGNNLRPVSSCLTHSYGIGKRRTLKLQPVTIRSLRHCEESVQNYIDDAKYKLKISSRGSTW